MPQTPKHDTGELSIWEGFGLRRPSEQGKLALGGRDAMYLTAENTRWQSGAELDPADFQALLGHLTAPLPEVGRAPASGL